MTGEFCGKGAVGAVQTFLWRFFSGEAESAQGNPCDSRPGQLEGASAKRLVSLPGSSLRDVKEETTENSLTATNTLRIQQDTRYPRKLTEVLSHRSLILEEESIRTCVPF